MAEEAQIDPAVVAALYEEHGGELRRFLLGILRDEALVADVLQMTFVKALEKGHHTQAETRKAWLFRVAYHEALAIRRREAVGERVFEQLRLAAGSGNRSDRDSLAEQGLVKQEAVEQIKQAIASLPAPQAEVLRLRIYEEQTFAQIAEQLKIPLGTALGRMQSALAKLRASLGEAGSQQ